MMVVFIVAVLIDLSPISPPCGMLSKLHRWLIRATLSIRISRAADGRFGPRIEAGCAIQKPADLRTRASLECGDAR